jgi:hypothetical protein
MRALRDIRNGACLANVERILRPSGPGRLLKLDSDTGQCGLNVAVVRRGSPLNAAEGAAPPTRAATRLRLGDRDRWHATRLLTSPPQMRLPWLRRDSARTVIKWPDNATVWRIGDPAKSAWQLC